ncbi:MAG: DNA-binding transcriptional MerR regulator [Saprospiraceae bacterium]|jgi:DNA-binding transcriptional MerR regulator
MIDLSSLTKRYYTISEVSKMLDVNNSQLRFWEGEFRQIRPQKGRNGIRRYTKEDIAAIIKIQDLLKNRGFTIDGAKKELTAAKKSTKLESKNTIEGVLEKLKKIRASLP